MVHIDLTVQIVFYTLWQLTYLAQFPAIQVEICMGYQCTVINYELIYLRNWCKTQVHAIKGHRGNSFVVCHRSRHVQHN